MLYGRFLNYKPTEMCVNLDCYDETWEMDIIDFSNEAIFKQRINVLDSNKFTLKGNVNFMVCKDGSCLAPEDYKFEIVLNE